MRKLYLPFPILAATLAATPALAHHDDEHGLPGALHPMSADHLGWPLLAAVVLLAAFAFRKPIQRAIRARVRR